MTRYINKNKLHLPHEATTEFIMSICWVLTDESLWPTMVISHSWRSNFQKKIIISPLDVIVGWQEQGDKQTGVLWHHCSGYTDVACSVRRNINWILWINLEILEEKINLIKLDNRCHNISDTSKSEVNDYAFSCICINCILVAESTYLFKHLHVPRLLSSLCLNLNLYGPLQRQNHLRMCITTNNLCKAPVAILAPVSTTQAAKTLFPLFP